VTVKSADDRLLPCSETTNWLPAQAAKTDSAQSVDEERFLTPATIEACRLLNDGFLPRHYAATRHPNSGSKTAQDDEDYDERFLLHDANATTHHPGAATEQNDNDRFLPHDVDTAHYRMNDDTADENVTTKRHRVDERLLTKSTQNTNDGFLPHDDVTERYSPYGVPSTQSVADIENRQLPHPCLDSKNNSRVGKMSTQGADDEIRFLSRSDYPIKSQGGITRAQRAYDERLSHHSDPNVGATSDENQSSIRQRAMYDAAQRTTSKATTRKFFPLDAPTVYNARPMESNSNNAV